MPAPTDEGTTALPAGPEGALPRRMSRTLEDHLLASALGDVEAFTAMYDALAPRVYGMVLKVLGDVHQSEEVTQEVFIQLWHTSTRFDPHRGSALSWVMTLAHRRAVDRVRTATADRRRDTVDAARGARAPFDETAFAAHASLEAQRVRAAVASLSTVQREAVELAYFGGFTYSEVAKSLQVPLGTAKSRIRDGLLRLRDLLSVVVVVVEPV